MARNRGWNPPRKAGYRKIFDSRDGTIACWMRRESDDTVTAIVYLDWIDSPYDGIWTVNALPGSPILGSLYDKPRRVTLAFDPGNRDGFWGRAVSHAPIPRGRPRRRGVKVRQDWTCRKNVARSRSHFLPRKFR